MFVPGTNELLIIAVMLGGGLMVGLLVLGVVLFTRKGATQSQFPNLLPCPDCGRMVSRLATSCAQCGRPMEPQATD